MRLGAVLLLSALATCTPPPPQNTCMPTLVAPTDNGLPIAGDELVVVLQVATWCNDSVKVTANVSVRDPNGDPVTLSEGSTERAVTARDPDRGMNTTVKARSTIPGQYLVTARFDPGLGLVQEKVLVAENHRDAGPVYIAKGDGGLASCLHIDLSEQGRLLCLAAGNVKVLGTDGTLLQTLSTGLAARAGPVVWTTSSTVVLRWEETDAGFVQTTSVVVPVAPVLLAPERDDLIVAEGTTALQVFKDGGTEARTELPRSTPFAWWRNGSRAMVYDRNGLCWATIPDGGTTCAPPPREAIGNEPDKGIWAHAFSFTRAGTDLTLFRYGGDSVSLALPPSWTPPLPVTGAIAAWDTAPVLSSGTGWRFASENAGAIVLQAFPDGLVLLSATSSWVSFYNLATDQVLIYRR